MSVMEAELYEASQAVLMLEGVSCLVEEILGCSIKRRLFVDNAAAVSMLQGSTASWRTRHLRVRCSYVRDQISRGLLQVQHLCGDEQLADLATKMHPKHRLWELLILWGFENLPAEAAGLMQAKRLILGCLILLTTIWAHRVEAGRLTVWRYQKQAHPYSKPTPGSTDHTPTHRLGRRLDYNAATTRKSGPVGPSPSLN